MHPANSLVKNTLARNRYYSGKEEIWQNLEGAVSLASRKLTPVRAKFANASKTLPQVSLETRQI
jgi:hypothetical protein